MAFAHVELRLGLVVVGLGRDPALQQVGEARQHALSLLLLRLRRGQRRLQHGDLFRALADPQVGELRLGLGERGFGLRDGDRRVARLPAWRPLARP